MNLRHLKLWKRHTPTTGDAAAGDVSKSRDAAADVRSPSSDSGYSDVAPTYSSMFSRQQQHGHHGHLPAPGHRGRSAADVSGRRKPDAPTAAGQFRGLRGSSTPRSAAAESTRRTLSPPSTDVKSPSAPKTTTTTTTLAGGVTVEAFFSVVREGNVDKLRQFLRDTKFDVNARDTVGSKSVLVYSLHRIKI